MVMNVGQFVIGRFIKPLLIAFKLNGDNVCSQRMNHVQIGSAVASDHNLGSVKCEFRSRVEAVPRVYFARISISLRMSMSVGRRQTTHSL